MKNDPPIPGQISRAEQWSAQHQAVVGKTILEPSATDDDRPQFQAIIAQATSAGRHRHSSAAPGAHMIAPLWQVPNIERKWRATTGEDEHYSFAVAL